MNDVPGKRGLCVRFPPKIHSVGVWNKRNPLSYSLPTLELQFVVIFLLTRLLHFPLKRFRVPLILSEILAGIILGPTLLGRIKKYQFIMFPFETQGIIDTFSVFGYGLFIFLTGVKIDMGIVKRTGKMAWMIGILSLMAPLVTGIFSAWLLLGSLLKHEEIGDAKNLGTIVLLHSMTPFPVIACLLKDLKILNSELGRLALSSAIVSDLFVMFLTTMGVTIYISGQHPQRALVDLALFLGLVIVIVFIIRPTMIWVVKHTPVGRPVKDIYIYLIILFLLLCAVFCHFIEQSVFLGTLMIGLTVPAGPPLGSTVVDKLDPFVSGLLMPVFISLSTMRINLSTIHFTDSLALANVTLIIVTFSAKLVGCLLLALYCSMPFSDALALSLIMCTKGSVHIAIYRFIRENQTLTRETFALLVVVVALTAFFVQILVKYLYDPSRKYAGYQRRNIVQSEEDGKLQILMCIHRPDNISAAIKLLDASNPTQESPISVYVLHLIALQGRATPLFISHQIQQKPVSSHSYSEDVILAFRKYERGLNRGAVLVHAFTAISPRKLMHEDICTLGLNTLASIVIIPFHKKWAIDGSVESEDHSLRTLNFSVLDRAPCSVGILVDRGQFGSLESARGGGASSYHIAVIFLGGNDDQEALTYAKRMARNSGISLTVLRLISKEDEGSKKRGKMIDLLEQGQGGDFKLNSIGNGHVKYIEEVVKDGPATALKVCPMVNEFDLIIVGRRNNLRSQQTAGLEQWSEFPELGLIGELLAISMLKSRTSVLVVQQQNTIHL
uniref:Putative cation/H(+) antiporter 4-like n=1 Tax=Davidia involucrata TaxID=16924 RepID=A0A5B7BGZ0_DAVIN